MSGNQKFVLGVISALGLAAIVGCLVVTLLLPVGVGNWRATVAPAVQRPQVEETETDRGPVGITEPTSRPEPTKAPAKETEAEEEPLPSQGDEEPQPEIGHPSLYVETGTEGTKSWTLEASDDEVVIVGGFCVDNRCNGVYKAYEGPVTVEVDVTDGFALVAVEEWSAQEFCFRINQARELGWAHEHVEPLKDWEPCQ
jgi:hypothetical protein